MLISIIIPVYNVEKYLQKCLDSILNQDFHDYEVLLVDDGSSDSSSIICDEYANKNNKVKVIHKPNAGVSSARNLGIDMAQGKYICFVDSDDWLELDYFNSIYRILCERKPDLLLNVFVKDQGLGKPVNKFCYHQECIMSRDEAVWQILDNTIVGWEPYASFYKTSLCKNIKFPENICFGEDLMFKYNFIRASKDEIFFCPIAKYHYYVRPGSACNSYSVEKKTDDLKVFEFIMEHEEDNIKDLIFCKEYLPRLIKYSINAIKNKTDKNFVVRKELRAKIDRHFFKAISSRNIEFVNKLKLLFCNLPDEILNIIYRLYKAMT